jgi:Arc/MetJ-type ribon-helix-helix transcriptional regulator
MSEFESLVSRSRKKGRRIAASGRCVWAGELGLEALRNWQQRQNMRLQAAIQLQKLWDEGINSGEPVLVEGAFERIKIKIDQMVSDRR